MRHLTIIIITLLLTACTGVPIHQGNRLHTNKVAMVRKGDTQFHIEEALGYSVLKDVLHPNSAVYYEQFKDKKSGDMVKRRVVVVYDDAMRAISIKRFGFEHKTSKSQ